MNIPEMHLPPEGAIPACLDIASLLVYVAGFFPKLVTQHANKLQPGQGGSVHLHRWSTCDAMLLAAELSIDARISCDFPALITGLFDQTSRVASETKACMHRSSLTEVNCETVQGLTSGPSHTAGLPQTLALGNC